MEWSWISVDGRRRLVVLLRYDDSGVSVRCHVPDRAALSRLIREPAEKREQPTKCYDQGAGASARACAAQVRRLWTLLRPRNLQRLSEEGWLGLGRLCPGLAVALGQALGELDDLVWNGSAAPTRSAQPGTFWSGTWGMPCSRCGWAFSTQSSGGRHTEKVLSSFGGPKAKARKASSVPAGA